MKRPAAAMGSSQSVSGAPLSGAPQPAAVDSPAQQVTSQSVSGAPLGSSQSISGAAPSAALSSSAQNVIDDVKKFGRLPKRILGPISEDDRAENKLAKRWHDQESFIPEGTPHHRLA